MAGLAHLGVGLAAKRVAPKVPLAVLITGAYAIDIIWGMFYFAGLEHFPEPGVVSSAPYSHSLFMAIIWSALAGIIVWFIKHNHRTSILIGLIVFSHWVVDFITQPMTIIFPDNTGLLLFFEGSPEVGLGLYRTQMGVNIGEYGTLILGIIIYSLTLMKLRKDKKLLAQM
jgi:hypothetical protein